MLRRTLFLLSLLLLIPFSFSLSQIGESCQYTKDCENGYCIDTVCVLPEVSAQQDMDACNITADCLEGYCVENTCILPTIRSELLEFGIKSGCAGLVGGTDALSSFLICGTIWLLVFLFSIVSAYTSNKQGYTKLVTIAALLLPLFIALLLYPFIGAIAGLIELALIMRGKGRR